jgi:hypothetical protein
VIRFGRQTCGALDEAVTREWLVTQPVGAGRAEIALRS